MYLLNVYERMVLQTVKNKRLELKKRRDECMYDYLVVGAGLYGAVIAPVSYTHLTLPTTPYV